MTLRHIKKMMAAAAVALFVSCAMPVEDEAVYNPGVSIELATLRKAEFHDVSYNLFFSIPEKKADDITGTSEITLTLDQQQPVIIDFRAESSQVKKVTVDGNPAEYTFEDEHIVVSETSVKAGVNNIKVEFVADDQSLNRRDDFMYTLLVPDRARTLFPCFDQPDIKAHFSLQLDIPAEWQAVANGHAEKTDTASVAGRKHMTFSKTEPLSTYLFSFVVGKMYSQSFTKDGRTIVIYHRETDPKKVAQCSDIADEVFYDLKWQEEYTGIPYPFAKYDLVIVPGFQFGGMEHIGATLYNDSRMFLNENPTLSERLERSVLIAHETTHMWFGDLVTMKWFDDVWTKEVFANFYGSMIAEPHFPDVNHRLNFMLDYIPAAYSEDRTQGTNTIKQQLDNLNNAGLMYGNIIYKKSPIVMNKLYTMMGDEPFRKGMQEYLKTYSYGNATWEDLITILDKYTDHDLQKWSHVWCNEKGMPEITARVEDGSLVVEQKDPWNRGLCWPQTVKYAVVSKNHTDTVTVDMLMDNPRVTAKLASEPDADAYIIPNVDGTGYGFFRIAQNEINPLFKVLSSSDDELLRGSLLITLHENLLNNVIPADKFMNAVISYIRNEKNELLYSQALSYITNCQRLYPIENPAVIENALWQIMLSNRQPQRALQAFRTYRGVASTPEAVKRLYSIWKNQTSPATCSLSEGDYIKMSYKLAILRPEQADEIVATQLQRITNPDRKNEYAFVSPSVSPRKEVRDSVFNALLDVKNRAIEPWASAALANLNNTYRQAEAVSYLLPALEEIQEIQRTGDIFFPGSWAWSLMYYHNTPEAAAVVKKFFEDHPDYPGLLKNKILQRADHLYRLK